MTTAPHRASRHPCNGFLVQVKEEVETAELEVVDDILGRKVDVPCRFIRKSLKFYCVSYKGAVPYSCMGLQKG